MASSDHVGQRVPPSKLQSQGETADTVVRGIVVVDEMGGDAVGVVGTASFMGLIEQLLVVNVKSSIEMSP